MRKSKLNNVAVILPFGGGDPVEFARVLAREHRLPPNDSYTFSCAASSWLKATSEEAEVRKHYEADAWERLKLDELVTRSSPSVIGVVGLATGEGLGEIELLRNILREGYTVHYMAVDLSPVLLVAHIETIREVFDQELKDGRLLCVGVLGEVFEDLGDLVCMGRAEFKRSCALGRDEEFLPRGSLLLLTFLGNCLGNNSAHCEKLIFTTISKTFAKDFSPIVVLAGVSVMRSEPDCYSASFSDFLLTTPRYIYKELNILRSKRLDSDHEDEEFVIPADVESCARRFPQVSPKSYESDGIKGQIYNFYYKLAFDLEMPSENLTVPAGTTLSLYTVTKFKPETLAASLAKDGFTVMYDPDFHKRITTEFGVREYAMFAAVFPNLK